MKSQSYRDLLVWQKGIDLRLKIFLKLASLSRVAKRMVWRIGL